MKMKLVGLIALAGVGVGSAVVSWGAISGSLSVVGSGLAVSTVSVGGLLAVLLHALRTVQWRLSALENRLDAVGGSAPGAPDLAHIERTIQREVSEVIRTVDGRIIGLFETLMDGEARVGKGR